MFVYVKFTEISEEYTVLSFRGGNEAIKVNSFDVSVVSLESDDESKIDELITKQSSEINCTKITKEEFRELVKDTAQLIRIRDIVKARIAEKYDVADEMAMLKKDETDEKRVTYEAWVSESITIGTNLKSNIGY